VPPASPQAIYLEQDQDQIREMARQAAEQARQAAEDVREHSREIAEQAREQAEQAREQSRAMSETQRDQAREMAQQAAQQARDAMRDMHIDVPMPAMPNLNFNFDFKTPVLAQARLLRSNDGSLYGRGQNALDDHKYDQALDNFNEVVARGGPKIDGALYWKAYTLNKLGRRDDAVAAINQLRTQFPSSHWLDDAKALELEVNQASGKAVSPDSESDDELKLMALNGLSQTDPARAYPAIE
jgi:TolA-binding protein